MTHNIPGTMCGVLLKGHGGFEQLEYREDIATPAPGPGAVLIRVAAAGVNNTDINTRIGWYAESVRDATDAAAGESEEIADAASWSGTTLQLPRIQGADACGHIVAVGDGVASERIGQRVLVRPMQSAGDPAAPMALLTFGSEIDGGFAQYAVVRSTEALAIDSDWSDAELASLPCAYSTAEGMLSRGQVAGGQVLITGASGGVGSAAVQLALRRGAEVVAVAAAAKADDLRRLGAGAVIHRGESILEQLGNNAVDVVLDLVGGPAWPELLDVLRTGGTYVTSGAIAGPIVELDLRKLYLKDLTLYGSTFQPDEIFANLIGYVERNEIRPLLARTYALRDIVTAQQDFLAKRFTGKLVLLPP